MGRKNEQGYALVVVLLIIVIVAVMIPPLYTSLSNSVKQYDLTVDQIRNDRLVEIGMVYVNQTVDEFQVALNDSEQDEESVLQDLKQSFIYEDNVKKEVSVEFIYNKASDVLTYKITFEEDGKKINSLDEITEHVSIIIKKGTD